MLIIGGHDYYDIALEQGVDKHIVFNRKEIVYDDTLPGIYRREGNTYYRFRNTLIGGFVSYTSRNKSTYHKMTYFSVYAAGVFYVGVEITPVTYGPTPPVTKIFYDNEKMYEYIKSVCVDGTPYTQYDKPIPFDLSHFKLLGSVPYDNKYNPNRDAMIEKGIITAYAEHRYVEGTERFSTYTVCNDDKLRKFEMFRIVSPYQMFQNISQYIGGVLVNHGKPMVTISDKDKIHKHGFDKHSFRKGKVNG